MISYRQTWSISPRLWVAFTATLFAGIITFLASLNLYLLEDGNPLTTTAYSVSPLLRFSFDGVYLSALVTGVAICALVGHLLVKSSTPILIGFLIVSLFVALAGFGGLFKRYPSTFLVLFTVFAGLTLISVVGGRIAAARSHRRLGQRSAAILGSCVSASIALLANLVALIPHTLTLNPVSHPLYMQGQVGSTHFNSVLIAMGIELLSIAICALTIGLAFRPSSRSS